MPNRPRPFALHLAVLKIAPDDVDALRCKAVALVHTSAYGDALALLQTAALSSSHPYERAYCLYRLGRFDEALAALQECGADKAAAALQLEAQLRYRMGQSKQCIQVRRR